MPRVTSAVPSKIPDWLIILTVYSMVIVGILLISNVTPNGKLYIHFTAFWSMIIYFLLDDNLNTDVIDTLVESMVVRNEVKVYSILMILYDRHTMPIPIVLQIP